MSSTSCTDQLFMSPKSFYITFSGSLSNISEDHKEFFSNHVIKLLTNVFFTGFSPHTEVEIINSRLLVGTFYKYSCLILDVELDQKHAEVGLIHIICKPNSLNEDQQQQDSPFHLVVNVAPNYQLHNINIIDSNGLREKWQLLLKLRRRNRGAIAGVFIGDDLIQSFHAEKLRFIKGENPIHYEELLIREIDPYLGKMSQEPHNGAPEGWMMKILFYIPISPCFKRETETIVPCFFQLLENADRWQKKYNCRTYVGFTYYYGPLYSLVLDNIPESEILRINSVFYPYAKKSGNGRIKLNWKKIKNKIDEMKKQKKFQKFRHLSKDVEKCFVNLHSLAKSELELNQYLISGKDIINSSGFDSAVKNTICQALCSIWEEMIEHTRLELLKEKFKADYKKKFVESFLKHQNFSSRDDSLQFCLIDEQHLSACRLQSDCHSLDDKNICSRKDCETVNSDQTGHL